MVDVIHGDINVFGVCSRCALLEVCGRVEAGKDRALAVEIVAARRNALAGNAQDGFIEVLGTFDICHWNQYPVESWHFGYSRWLADIPGPAPRRVCREM